MTTQQCITRLADRLRQEVVKDLAYQRAVSADFLAREDFERVRVTPAVYEGALPNDVAEYNPDDERPQTHLQAPCVVVTTGKNASSITSRDGKIEQEIRLLVQVWDPGRRETDADGNVTYASGGEAGYRDLTDFVDVLTTALAEAEMPSGILIKGDVNYVFSDFNSAVSKGYYAAEITFTVNYHRFLKPTFENYYG